MRSRYIQSDILFYLSDGKSHSSKELSEIIEVSEVTIRRHMKDLSLNYPIVSFSGGVGGGGGYIMLSFSSQLLTKADVEIIVKALEKNEKSDEISTLITKLKKHIRRIYEGNKKIQN